MLRDALAKLLELSATKRIDIAMALSDSLTPAEQEAEFDLTVEQRAGSTVASPSTSLTPLQPSPREEVRRKLLRGA